METLGIYVHIPYCLKKCNYCDFCSEPLEIAKQNPEDYANQIVHEIEEKAKVYKEKYYVDTIFFGGGTPTAIGVDLIGRILIAIKQNFHLLPDAEITIEANPETVNDKKASILKFLGFNRISMGVQSFDDEVLKTLGRVHDAKKAVEAYVSFRKAGFSNINIDLMLGVPGLTFEIWKKTLEYAIRMKPEHLSFYSLQIEEGTPFYEAYKLGNLEIPSWEENRKMYWYAVKRLKNEGFHHYEVSNAAKPGFECKHNMKYWTMKPYLGFGTSAHSFIDGKRTDDDNPDLETDWLFTGLRLVDGTDFGQEICQKYEPKISKLVSDGYLTQKSTCLKLTEKGLDNTNNVIEELIN